MQEQPQQQISLEAILVRFTSLYPLLAKQRQKQTSGGNSGAFISASNQSQAKNSEPSAFDANLSMIDKVKLISTIAKSEVAQVQTSQQASDLSNQLLPKVDEICQTTEIKQSISDQGLFMICVLTRLVKFSDPSTCREILKILLARASNYLIVLANEYEQETDSSREISLCGDEFLNEQLTFAIYVLRKGILSHELAQGQPVTQTCHLISEALTAITAHNALVNAAEDLNPSRFAPTALWYSIVRAVYERVHEVRDVSKDFDPLGENPALKEASSQLLEATLGALKSFRAASKYHIQAVSEGTAYLLHGSVVRVSQLFGEELDTMIQFSVAHLTAIPDDQSAAYCRILFKDVISGSEGSKILDSAQQECFTIMERLTILKKLNGKLQSIPDIYSSTEYWGIIKAGLAHIDQAPRKISLVILKQNLTIVSAATRQLTDEAEFQNLWTTFFDIMDTLESFGSHLIKCIWPRVDIFYDFILKHKAVYSSQQIEQGGLNPLEDFRGWLMVIFDRINSHMNLKIRRHVIKETLKRPFMTTNLPTFLFSQYLTMLNTGLIFKDLTFYCVFSKNADLVYQFYCRYFENESEDLGGDLWKLMKGMLDNYITHPQVYLILLKVLQTKFRQDANNGQVKVFGNESFKIIERILTKQLKDQYFSARYMCHKYIVRMLSNYAIPAAESNQISGHEFDWSTFFTIVGQLPLEFFCTRTVNTDAEGIQGAADLIEVIGRQDLQTAIADYLSALFTVNAMPSTMPKFGVRTEAILKGICNMVLMLTTKYEDPLVFWLQQFMEPILDSFRQSLSSTYLQHKLVEAKVECFANLTSRLYEYGTDKLRACLRTHIFLPQVSQLLSRFNDNLLEPVSRTDAFVPSEQERFNAAFSKTSTYASILGLAIQMVHLHENRSDNAIEAAIKNVLQRALKITVGETNAAAQEGKTWYFGRYLLQYVLIEALQKICETYATGINESIKRGVSFFFVPDDLFTVGNSVLHALIVFTPQRRPNGPDELTNELANFFEVQDLGLTKINESVMMSIWKTIASMVQVFQHDESLKQELITVQNKRVADKTIDFLDAVTQDFNDVIFRVLRLTYIPTVVMRITAPDVDDQTKTDCVEELQQVIRRCWTLLKQMGAESYLEPIQEFVELAFTPDLLSAYQTCLPEQLYESVVAFHTQLFTEICQFADKYWLLMRSTFNHLMFMFIARPHLLASFETFIIGFGTTRELRSLDSEIKLYKLQTILPQVVPMKYETMDMELISYHGAYIRTMTLLIVEGIIKNHLLQISQGFASPQIDLTSNALENIFREMMHKPLEDKNYRKPEQPWSFSHRLHMRHWQFLLVLMQLLDPQIYTPAYRQERVSKTGQEDIVQFIMKALWLILQRDYVPSVRQYIEMFTIKFMLRFPDIACEDPSFSLVLLDPKSHKTQVSSSLLIVAGYILVSDLDTPNAVTFKRKIYEQMLGFVTSNSAYSRCVAQYFIMRGQKDKQFGAAFMPSGVQPILDYLNTSKDVQKMLKKYSKDLDGYERLCLNRDGVDLVLSTKINKEGEFVGLPLIEALKTLTTEVMTEYRKEDYIPIERRDWWKEELKRRKEEGEFQLVMNSEQTENYQKKILPWEELEVDHEKQKRAFMQRQRNEIIMCASLIDKVPNLAGLSRTAEIMNASSLIINNNNYLSSEEFKAISVTSEKWLPIYQVIEKDLLDYLAYQKSNGYKVLGLEQTANSKMLHEFDFPSKCILLLGKEKEGIPQEYYGILDECIEIPQFGIIRSLNVHVSGALCLWEYTKQQIVKSQKAAVLPQ